MKIFISWSGAQGKAVALALRSWLTLVIQVVEPFVSSQDIPPGDRNMPVIADELEVSSFGILCLTRESLQAPWVNFEAGALSKRVGVARVVPFLLDITPADITGPLKQFQAVSSTNRDEVYHLLEEIRAHSGVNLADNQLRRTFDAFWDEFEADLERARNLGDVAAMPVRSADDLLEEILLLTRGHADVLRRIVDRVDSAIPLVDLKRRPDRSGAVRVVSPWSDDADVAIADRLVKALGALGEAAQSYRVIEDRFPQELQMNFAAGSISPANVDDVLSTLGGFALDTNRSLTIKTRDGYHIIAEPGKGPVVITEPVYRESPLFDVESPELGPQDQAIPASGGAAASSRNGQSPDGEP